MNNKDHLVGQLTTVNHEPIEEMEVDENEKIGKNSQEKVDANLLKLESILSKMREL